MEWYIWVIIALALVIVALIVTIWGAARVAEEAFLQFAVKPWLEGNFGRRDRR